MRLVVDGVLSPSGSLECLVIAGPRSLHCEGRAAQIVLAELLMQWLGTLPPNASVLEPVRVRLFSGSRGMAGVLGNAGTLSHAVHRRLGRWRPGKREQPVR